ncbi:hypothetical protein [Altericista sp. CCNU0014]|uniref:hypothetical protein n=1 Tax=Altericista sp. CCNU0014 TaxID=3082949 RepID=UPI00384E63FC
MEIKYLHNLAPAGFLLMALLLGDRPLTPTSNSAWAQSANSPSPAETAPADFATPSTPYSDPAHSNSGQEPQDATNGSVPAWLWFALGGLGLWNLALSFLVWQSLKDSNGANHKMMRKLKELDAKDGELNQRISRKSALIEELRGQLSSYKKTLEVVQLQAQPKSARADDFGFDARNQPARYGNDTPFASNDVPASKGYDYTARVSALNQPAPTASNPWDSIVQNYNLSPQVLESSVIERVSETEESVASRRNGNAAVFLKSANNYSYWIFMGEDRNYWLTPKSDLKITPMGFDTLQALFECPEYQQGSKIQTIKPAKVSQNSLSGGWDLLEKGQVQFTR